MGASGTEPWLYLEQPEGLLERPLWGTWNPLERAPALVELPEGLMEQSRRLYMERALAHLEQSLRLYLEQPKGLLERPPGHLEQSRRLYLERAPAQLERALAPCPPWGS